MPCGRLGVLVLKHLAVAWGDGAALWGFFMPKGTRFALAKAWALGALGHAVLGCVPAALPTRALAIATRPELAATATVGQAIQVKVLAQAEPGLCLQSLVLEVGVDASDRSFTLKPVGQPVSGVWNHPCPADFEATASLVLPAAGRWVGLVWEGRGFAFDELRTPVVQVDAVASGRP